LADKLKILVEDSKLYLNMSLYNDKIDDFKDSVMIKKHIELYFKVLNK